MSQVFGLAYIDLVCRHHRSCLVCGGLESDPGAFMKRTLNCKDFLDFRGEHSPGIIDFFRRLSDGETGLIGIFIAPTESVMVLQLTSPQFGLSAKTIALIDFVVILKTSKIIQAIAEPMAVDPEANDIIFNYPYHRGRFDELIWSGRSLILEKIAEELELPVQKLIKTINRDSQLRGSAVRKIW